ncbi:helix-turn-helix domain-containing protein [Riemerella columbina]|uniref:helix-turn-helix domain-containing protein n=1 Tax=Riemerella columbina TaxID=103810 RepID=UPI00266F5C04|nr:helix-turn-helix transcriptional regulator [Riemerella columbina]WKS95289.1 helix-turn-helix domain-containing protein [Riemerella columbina]
MIGHKVKNIRELKNLTQEYMAEKLDISQAAYSKIEKGITKITEDKLSKIAEILEVNPEDITDFDNKKVLNSYNSIKGNNSNITYSQHDVTLIRQLYEDKITLLEKLLKKSEEEVEQIKKLLK